MAGDHHARLMGFDASEIFFWEDRLGSLSAAVKHEWEIVMDTFDPVNCRNLIAFLLSVPREQRSLPRCLLHRTAIGRMWPEALAVPINPETMFARTRRIVKGSGPYQRLRRALLG